MIYKSRITAIILILSLLLVTNNFVKAQSNWDWHIENALIIDGTGNNAYEADLLVRGDSIGFIGQVDPDTIKVSKSLNAAGKVLSPGFIDMHAHGNPLANPSFQNFLAMGVTTIVLGQDGTSSATGSLEKWFNDVQDVGPGTNIATLSGHGSIRRKLGIGRQTPTDSQLEQMIRLLQADLEDGAFGLSTGLEYVPGMYAKETELVRLAKVIGEYDALIMSHMRSEDDSDIEKSLYELAMQGKYAKVHASHLKVVYGRGSERADEILNYIERVCNKDSVSLTADIYPYNASYTGIGIVFPEWAKTESTWKQARKERPGELRRYLADKIVQRNGPEAMLFGSGKFRGMTLKQASQQQGKSPADLLLEIGPKAASAAHFVMDKELQDRLVTGEMVMISSDGSPTMHHPRGYGSFAKIIDSYVNDLKILTLKEAVHKMSGMSAERLGLKDRGFIKKGYKADLLLFNPDEIQEVATFERPHQLSEGFDWIMVNGKVVREAGIFNGNRNGRVLKREANE